MTNEYSQYGNYGSAYESYQNYIQQQQAYSAQNGDFSLVVNPAKEKTNEVKNSGYAPSAYNDIFSSGSIFSKYKDDVFAAQFFASKPWEKYTGAQSQNGSPFPPEIYGKAPAQEQTTSPGVSFTI